METITQDTLVDEVSSDSFLAQVCTEESNHADSQNTSISRLVQLARTTEVPWIVEGLWQSGGLAVIHSLEEEFKSVLSFQIGEAIATGKPLLRLWKILCPRMTGILNTEMDDLEMGKRLINLFPEEDYPKMLIVSDSELMKAFRRARSWEERFNCIDQWLRANNLEVLIWDTINSILSSIGNPNQEQTMSYFLEHADQLPLKGLLTVRHDGKPSTDGKLRHSNQRVRGSNRLVEDASLVLHLKRTDKAAHKVIMTAGKLRNATKPDPLEIWFDLATFRLTPILPVAALLENGPLSREELVEEAEARFRIKERTVDAQLRQLNSKGLISNFLDGHKRMVNLKDDPQGDLINWHTPPETGA